MLVYPEGNIHHFPANSGIAASFPRDVLLPLRLALEQVDGRVNRSQEPISGGAYHI